MVVYLLGSDQCVLVPGLSGVADLIPEAMNVRQDRVLEGQAVQTSSGEEVVLWRKVASRTKERLARRHLQLPDKVSLAAGLCWTSRLFTSTSWAKHL